MECYYTIKRNVSSLLLKLATEEQQRISEGNLFQSLGAPNEKDRKP